MLYAFMVLIQVCNIEELNQPIRMMLGQEYCRTLSSQVCSSMGGPIGYGGEFYIQLPCRRAESSPQ